MSGVVFTVTSTRPSHSLDGSPIYFCCAGCADYFSKNRERVVSERRLYAASPN